MKIKSVRFGMAIKLGGLTDFYWDTDKQLGCSMILEGGLIRIDYKEQHAYIPMPNVAQFASIEEVKVEPVSTKRKSAG